MTIFVEGNIKQLFTNVGEIAKEMEKKWMEFNSSIN